MGGGERVSRRACAGGGHTARPVEVNCPLLTKQCKSMEEMSTSEVPEIRSGQARQSRAHSWTAGTVFAVYMGSTLSSLQRHWRCMRVQPCLHA